MHTMIIGVTACGKTTLAKRMSGMFQAQEIPVGVLDPISDPGWNTPYLYSSPADFMALFNNSTGMALFVDEAAEVAGQYDDELLITATRGRHRGHKMHYLTQRYGTINATIRAQCTTLIIFRVTEHEAKAMIKQVGYSEAISKAPRLNRGEFIKITPFNETGKEVIFSSAFETKKET